MNVCRCVVVVLAIELVAAVGLIAGEEKSDDVAKSHAEVLATQRFEAMRERIAAAEVGSPEGKFPKQFESKPIFRFNDPARGCVSAAVWKLGEQGRPRALITTELHRTTYGKPCISYEYSSLTTTKFSVVSDDIQWSPTGKLYEFKAIPNAPAPDSTPQRRLIQMRAIAKRFAAHEEVDKERCELRLLTQPIDRYVPSNAKNSDGAIFLFAFGTNPEVVLILESDGAKWNYAAGRMTGAQSVVLTIDEAIAWQGAPLQKGNTSPYTGSITAMDIPGVSPDGNEIKE